MIITTPAWGTEFTRDWTYMADRSSGNTLMTSPGGHLSLSRLDHWPPGTQTHPEIMQCTADFHYQITDAPLPQPNPIFDDATALDTTIDMLNAKTAVMQ